MLHPPFTGLLPLHFLIGLRNWSGAYPLSAISSHSALRKDVYLDFHGAERTSSLRSSELVPDPDPVGGGRWHITVSSWRQKKVRGSWKTSGPSQLPFTERKRSLTTCLPAALILLASVLRVHQKAGAATEIQGTAGGRGESDTCGGRGAWRWGGSRITSPLSFYFSFLSS